MRHALAGIEADLATAREDRDKKQAALDEAQAKVDRLQAAKVFLRGGPPLEGATPEVKAPEPEAKAPRTRTPKNASKRARGSDPTRIGDTPVNVARLIEVLPDALTEHGNGGMTERQLDEAIGLQGQGRFNTLRAALRTLVERGDFIVANDTGRPNGRLYVASGKVAA